jgi:hypothetical protein
MTYGGNVSGTCALKAAGKGVVRGGEGRMSARPARTQRASEGLVNTTRRVMSALVNLAPMAGVAGVVGL